MKKTIILLAAISAVALSACKNEKKMMENPFFMEYTTPFQVPPFDQIDSTDSVSYTHLDVYKRQATFHLSSQIVVWELL